MPTLSVQLPGLPPVSHVLRDEPTTIGRMKGSTIVIDDASVSLMHAKITGKDGEYFLKDLNSTNGTLVNGQPVREVKLQDLDQICFADVIGQFHAEAATSAAAIPISISSTSAIARPATIQAPQFSPAMAAGSPPPAAPGRAKASNFTRRINVAAAVAAGLALLAVVSYAGWKLTQPNREIPADTASLKTPAVAGPAVNDSARSEPAASGVKRISAPAAAATTPEFAASENETVAHLMKSLHDQVPVERRRAAALLHSLGTEAREAVPALREALQDSDREVQVWAALTLVNNRSYDKPAIPILVLALQHENPTLRQVACLSLGIIPYENSEKQAVIPALAEIAGRDANDEVRKAAVSALDIIAPEVVARTTKK